MDLKKGFTGNVNTKAKIRNNMGGADSEDYVNIVAIREAETKLNKWKESKAKTAPQKVLKLENTIRKNQTDLYNRYNKVIIGMRGTLIKKFKERSVQISEIQDILEDYEGRASIKLFENVVHNFKIEKGDEIGLGGNKKRTYMFIYQMLVGTLSSMNRDIINRFFREKKGNKQFKGVVSMDTRVRGKDKEGSLNIIDYHLSKSQDNLDSKVYQNDMIKTFRAAIIEMEAAMTKKELIIWKAKKEGQLTNKVFHEAGIKPKNGKERIELMKEELKRLIHQKSIKNGNEFSYQDLINEIC